MSRGSSSGLRRQARERRRCLPPQVAAGGNARPGLSRVSPDGRWVVYDSTESGRSEIYVQAFPGPGRKWQISTNEGSDARFSPTGDELYYLDAGQNMNRVSVQTGETFEAGIPEPMFSVSLRPITIHNRYLVAPDGDRFLLLGSLRDDDPTNDHRPQLERRARPVAPRLGRSASVEISERFHDEPHALFRK